MRQFAIAILVALAVGALACGHSNVPRIIQTNTSGNWEAQLIGGTGPNALLNFVTQFNVQNTNNGNAPEPLEVTGFSFINTQTSGSCFVAASLSGNASLVTTSTDAVTGTMEFTIKSQVPAGNILTLSATNVTGNANGTIETTLSNGIAFGSWQLTSTPTNPACTANGTFVMCQGAATCTPP